MVSDELLVKYLRKFEQERSNLYQAISRLADILDLDTLMRIQRVNLQLEEVNKILQGSK